MDTVEQLNGTYFYAGKSNLSAAELFFMVFCEKTLEQFQVETIYLLVPNLVGLLLVRHMRRKHPERYLKRQSSHSVCLFQLG
jgi:hypothetical protein